MYINLIKGPKFIVQRIKNVSRKVPSMSSNTRNFNYIILNKDPLYEVYTRYLAIKLTDNNLSDHHSNGSSIFHFFQSLFCFKMPRDIIRKCALNACRYKINFKWATVIAQLRITLFQIFEKILYTPQRGWALFSTVTHIRTDIRARITSVITI